MITKNRLTNSWYQAYDMATQWLHGYVIYRSVGGAIWIDMEKT